MVTTSTSARVFDRHLLARRRDRWAGVATAHDFLLRHAADDIADRLSIIKRGFGKALVVGAAHGVLGERVRQMLPSALVIETEIAPRLLASCAGPRVLADDEALPFKEASFELAVSAMSWQHVNDLPGTLAQLRRILKPDGLLLASFLGGATLMELRQSFLAAEAELEGGASPRVAPFADVRDAGALLQRAGFALPVADSDTLDVTYATPFDLMRELQRMGGSNVMIARRRTPLRRATLMRAAEIYMERFAAEDGRIRATFEIVTITGWVPHENQQKPLRPGSATASLAEVLEKRDGHGRSSR